MKATNELKNEHQGIELMLRILQAVADKWERGEAIDAEDLEGLLEFLAVFVDKCHHGKEEEFLFPALEAAGVRRDGGPIGVLLDEHAQGRKLVARLGDAVARHTSGDKTAAAGFKSAAGEYVTLLTRHIEKENHVLFATADAELDPTQDKELFESFETLERERIGPGKHEEFHALLDRLAHEHLK